MQPAKQEIARRTTRPPSAYYHERVNRLLLTFPVLYVFFSYLVASSLTGSTTTTFFTGFLAFFSFLTVFLDLFLPLLLLLVLRVFLGFLADSAYSNLSGLIVVARDRPYSILIISAKSVVSRTCSLLLTVLKKHSKAISFVTVFIQKLNLFK